MYSLEYLFSEVKTISEKVRKNNSNFDGRDFWQPIKRILNDLNISFISWKHIDKNHRELLNIVEKNEDGTINEKNHFMRQLANIPCNDNPTLTKIIQIALNIGQLLGTTTLKEQIDKKYEKLETYVNKKDIEIISKKIPKNVINEIIDYLDKH